MKKDEKKETAAEKALEYIRKHKGIIRTSEALKAGIHPRTFYMLRDSGQLEKISRGVYRLSDLEPVSNLDILTVASRVPGAVVCLISALAYHDITTQIPRKVYVALKKGAETPRIQYPPLSVHRYSHESFNAGMEKHEIDGITVRIYNIEKTLIDCFKFRNKIGMDVFLEALKLYRTRRKFKLDELLKYARICRVEKQMKPYLETILWL